MQSKPRVLYIDAAPFTGGAQMSFASIINELHAKEECYVVSAGGLHDCASSIPHTDVTAHHWGGSLTGFFQMRKDAAAAAPLLQHVFDTFKPQLIHANCIRSLFLLKAGHLNLPCPIVLHDRDSRFPIFTFKILNNCTGLSVIAVSSNVTDKWKLQIPPSNVHVIPNGLDLNNIQGTTACPLPFQRTSHTFVPILVADFIPWKNHDLFIKAIAAAIAQSNPDIKAVIKGRTRDPNSQKTLGSLQKLAHSLHLDNYLFFETDDESALPWIAASDILVSCALNEPFGRTIIEALALGKPVVAVKDAGAPEILNAQCRALSIAERSAKTLAETILKWDSPTERDRVCDDARELAEQFTLQKSANAIHNLHLNIIKKYPPQSQ